ncbi:DNA repair protein RecO [Mucilaginibacter arboris]|uniref:DNA repair protein RecO n=1 Tax=Mucilaginibacter arboris TaxID=2682090 RepID=A0A7K1SX73_9SPHI|nr:DNA repair protein RecO [Mucilaginibacter arboris]MVN21838.1 DNA repair protein RecO [Mucilaginibacter arboris]
MLHKTRGIVFKTTDYSESSVIVQVFTEKFGLQSYLINGVKKPRAKISRSMLQPLHLLEMVAYHKPNGNIQRVTELKNAPVLKTVPYDVIKSSLVIFLNEVVYKAVRQQETDPNLFNFIFYAVEWLDNQELGLANFHLLFLLQLSRYLGFHPERNEAENAAYFDLKDGLFITLKPEHNLYLAPPYTQYFNLLIGKSFEDLVEIKLPNDVRRFLLDRMIEYYALHIDSFGQIKSHEILEEVLG